MHYRHHESKYPKVQKYKNPNLIQIFEVLQKEKYIKNPTDREQKRDREDESRKQNQYKTNTQKERGK